MKPDEESFTETITIEREAPRGDSSTVGAPSGELPPPAVAIALPARYTDLGRIAGGASGDVRRARDHLLERTVAIKVLHAAHARSTRARERFLAEATITAELQHPGIVAVHDRGELPDGRLWFAMREVRGRTLGSVIAELHSVAGREGFVESPSGWTFRRLVDAFARISQAVAYAHRRGIVHRDLKPENLMVGELGEVLVMDWGLARRIASGPEAPHIEEASIDEPPPVSASSALTQHGDILGTPAYMPPEQAMGAKDLHGPRSDVYALGAILFHLLAGRAPYQGSGMVVWQQILDGPPPRLAEVPDRPPAPAELVAVCERAMQRVLHDRYPDAGALARDVVAWLDGARRREQALSSIARAEAFLPEIASMRDRADERLREAHGLLATVKPYHPVDRKQRGWDAEDEAAELEVATALRETEWLEAVHGALSLDPDLPEAHAALAAHYRERLLAAELGHRPADAARFEALLRAHDRGRHAAFLRGDGALTLVTDPPGAVVHLERYTMRGRRLVPVDLGVLGETPLHEARLPRGSYRLRLRAPGRAEVLYPVVIERDGHWTGKPDDARDPVPIALPREGELGPDDVYVPAGPSWIGGDSGAADSLPGRRIWIDAFVLRRFPVTNAEYLDFLNDRVAAGHAALALSLCPRSQLGMSDASGERLVFGVDDAGRFYPVEDDLGRPFRPDVPVTLVDWRSASAHARWVAERTGLPFRLPDELEREKAARGADGRLCPPGNHLDAAFVHVLDSHELNPMLGSIHDFPLDESPYGARGLAGNSRDWCGNVWRREGPPIRGGRLILGEDTAGEADIRAVRGGAWSSPLDLARSASRFGGKPEIRRLTTGIRLCRSYPGR